MIRALLLAVAALGLTACATVSHGPMQRIEVDSEPAGAIVETDDCGIAATRKAETPGVVWVSRRSDRCALTFHLRGYEPETVTLHREMADEFLGNVEIADAVCGGFDCLDFDTFLVGALFAGMGFGVDAATGALFVQQPDQVFVELLPVDDEQ